MAETVVPSEELVSKVARLYGMQGDSEALVIAADCLDEAVKEMNLVNWEFNVKVDANLTITEGSAEVALTVPWYKEKLAYLVNISDGTSKPPMTYLDWPTFTRLYGLKPEGGNGPGEPVVYSSRNAQEENKIYLAPTPSGSIATGCRLFVEYYRRTPLPSKTPQLTLPQEAEGLLLAGAKRRFAEHVAGPDSRDAVYFAQEEYKLTGKLRDSDKKHPDEATRFRLPWQRQRANSHARPFYIRID